jgi:hypothetical protein
MSEGDKSLDLIGIGKLAKSIPDEVYLQTTQTVSRTFESLIAPITETTSGFGRYIRQKFDNMVEVQKSLVAYSLKNAIEKIEKSKKTLIVPVYPKSFIRAIDETSKEVDPLLNIMWTNLLASQLSDQKSHPLFVHILSNLSSKEALLLDNLMPFEKIGKYATNVLIRPYNLKKWVVQSGGDLHEWDVSCHIICELGLAHYVVPDPHTSGEGIAILWLTSMGKEFLDVVSGKNFEEAREVDSP